VLYWLTSKQDLSALHITSVSSCIFPFRQETDGETDRPRSAMRNVAHYGRSASYNDAQLRPFTNRSGTVAAAVIWVGLIDDVIALTLLVHRNTSTLCQSYIEQFQQLRRVDFLTLTLTRTVKASKCSQSHTTSWAELQIGLNSRDDCGTGMRSIAISVYVCLFVCLPRAYLNKKAVLSQDVDCGALVQKVCT